MKKAIGVAYLMHNSSVISGTVWYASDTEEKIRKRVKKQLSVFNVEKVDIVDKADVKYIKTGK